MDFPPRGCYLDGMRLLACLLLLLLAGPARALDDEEAAAEREAAEAGRRLRAIDDAAERDADHPEVAGEDETDAADPVDDVEREPVDPYDDEPAAPAPPPRRVWPEKAPSYPNVLQGEAAGARDGKGAAGKDAGSKPSPLDVGD